MSKIREGHTHSLVLAFVDTLTCILGSMLLLWMAMVTRPRALAGFGGGPSFMVKLDAKTTDPHPGLGIRISSPDGFHTLADLYRKGLIIPKTDSTDGQESYALEFTKGASFAEKEFLMVYIHDLHGRRWDERIFLEVLVDDKLRPLSDDRYLDGNEPVLLIPLAQISGQIRGAALEWKRPGEVE